MANSDYKFRASATLATVAPLSAGVNPAATRFMLQRIIGNDPSTVVAGSAAMIDNEVVKIVAVGAGYVDVDRGCADTIPAPHSTGALIWFLHQSFGYDTQEYVTGESVAVKILVKSGAKRMAIENSPPQDLTFVGRAFRPYPPGNVLIDGTPWFSRRTLSEAHTELVFTWAHRDRLLQADILTGHQAGNIGPEPGTTYTVRVHKGDGTQVHQVVGITGTTFTYTVASARTHLAVGTNDSAIPGYITLTSVRGSVESLQRYRTDILVSGSGISLKRWGVSWGTSWAQ